MGSPICSFVLKLVCLWCAFSYSLIKSFILYWYLDTGLSIISTSLILLPRSRFESVFHSFPLRILPQDLSSQLSELRWFKLVPLRIRLFQRFCTFVLKVVGNNNVKTLVSRIKTYSEALRNPYFQPCLNSLYGIRTVLLKLLVFSVFKSVNNFLPFFIFLKLFFIIINSLFKLVFDKGRLGLSLKLLCK